MLIVPDFSEVADEVQPGTYKCTVKKAELKEWSDGSKYIRWQLETVDSAEPKNNGRLIFHKTIISGKGAFQLQKFYKAAAGQPLTGSFDTEQLLGKKIQVEVVAGVNRQTGEPTGYNEVKTVAAVRA